MIAILVIVLTSLIDFTRPIPTCGNGCLEKQIIKSWPRDLSKNARKLIKML